MGDFTHHEVDGFDCHGCGSRIDCVTPVEGLERPGPGDVSICWYCGIVAIFTETGARPPTAAEAMQLAFDPDVRRAQDRLARRH